MPSRNIIREFEEHSYYHVYNRGVEKRAIFLDDQDYTVFLGLLKKYLTGEKEVSKTNRHKTKSMGDELQLAAYCLMPNHFHLLFYQVTETAITEFMRRVSTGYVMYFNNRYNRVGSLFQSRFKASKINADAYLQHISRYIHMNPEAYASWPYSSFPIYAGKKKSGWVKADQIMQLFNNNPEEYKQFLRDYELNREELAFLKWQLANNPEDS